MREGSVRDGSVRDNMFSEESISRSYSRGSSTRSTGAKTPTDRPPSYKAKTSGPGGYIVEETITSKETSKVETSANDAGYGTRVGRGTALEVNYHEDEGRAYHTPLTVRVRVASCRELNCRALQGNVQVF